MKRLVPILLVVLGLGGIGLVAYEPVVGLATSLAGRSSIKAAYVVIDAQTIPKLPQSTILWLNSQPILDACTARGFALTRIDPDVVDRLNGETPHELAPIVAAARKAGLPQLVLISASGKLSLHSLPADDPAARKALGLGP